MSKQPLRKIWLKLHLYLGLVLGAPFAVLGLTGSLLVFGWPLDAWLNQDLMRVTVPQAAVHRPLQDIINAAQHSLPPNAIPINWLKFPTQADQSFRASYSLPPAKDSYEIFIDPYTATVQGQRLWGDFDACCSWHGPVMAIIYRLHDSFWLGEIGQVLVGSIGLLMLLSLISGMALWWPSCNQWRMAFALKPKTSRQRWVFDVHKLSGIYGLPVLLVLLLTGVYLEFPTQGQALVSVFSALTNEPVDLPCQPQFQQTAMTTDAAVQQFRQRFPNGKLDSLSLPITVGGCYGFYFFTGHEAMPEVSEGVAYLDAYSGAWRYVDDADKHTAGDVFHAWQFALHSGQGLGLAGQLLVLIGGLIPSILFITGFIRWRQKRRAYFVQRLRRPPQPMA